MNLKSLVKNKKGFTIIEVVLVLAIAGLIFLMVFIALPAMQRSQRDTQRKDDMARFNTAINNYQSNNSGKLPNDWSAFINNYLKVNGDKFADPDGEEYKPVDKGKVTGDIEYTGDFNHEIHIYTYAKCDGEKVTRANGSRNIAFQYKLEGGGVYCGNN